MKKLYSRLSSKIGSFSLSNKEPKTINAQKAVDDWGLKLVYDGTKGHPSAVEYVFHLTSLQQ